MLERSVNFIIKAVIFILPLFFLPWTSEYFEFNKQFLLWLVMPLALSLHLIALAARKRLKLKVNPLNLPVLIFLLLTFISSLFSLDRFSSFFGYFGRFSDAWLGLASLVMLYFLLVNTGAADRAGKIAGLIKLAVYSALAVAAISLLAMLGLTRLLAPASLSILGSPAFNPASGSLPGLGVFLAVMAVLTLAFLLRGGLAKFERVFFSAGLGLMLIDSALLNFSLSWILILAGTLLLAVFHGLAGLLNFKNPGRYLSLALLALAAIVFLVRPDISLSKLILGAELPREAALGNNQTLAISLAALKANPALGSGPGTFAFDFSLYRPSELNGGILWPIRFDKGGSHLLETLATTGILSWLSYFLIISLAVYLNALLIKKHFIGRQETAGTDYHLAAALFTVFILLFISQIFFQTNTLLNFSFWLFLGLLAAFWQSRERTLFKEKIMILDDKPVYLRFFWPLLFLFLAGVLTLQAFEIKFFAADVSAAGGRNRETGLARAAKLNPYRYNYSVSLAKFYLKRAGAEVSMPAVDRDNNLLRANVAKAVESARQATLAAPDSVLAWETLGMVYRDISSLSAGSEIWAVKAFSRAFELEPTNPALAAELAKAYLNSNDLAGAEKYFEKSRELKPDYYEAELGLAKVYLKEKKDGAALRLLSDLAGRVASPEVYYELGRYYFNHGEIDKAIDRFNAVLALFPGHSNSLYSLAIAYEAKGKAGEALKYYEKVLELNPGNAEVEMKIKELK